MNHTFRTIEGKKRKSPLMELEMVFLQDPHQFLLLKGHWCGWHVHGLSHEIHFLWCLPYWASFISYAPRCTLLPVYCSAFSYSTVNKSLRIILSPRHRVIVVPYTPPDQLQPPQPVSARTRSHPGICKVPFRGPLGVPPVPKTPSPNKLQRTCPSNTAITSPPPQ